LKGIRGNDGVVYTNHGALIGGFITLVEQYLPAPVVLVLR